MLRTLIRLCVAPILAFASLGFTPSFGEDYRLPTMQSHGALIEERLKEARDLGETLASRLKVIQHDFDLPADIVDRALASLNNGEVHEALGITPEFMDAQNAKGERYPEGVFVFASFSMPDAALKQLLQQGSDLGIPVVFNGFVNNSVTDTEARVRKVYGDDPETSDVTHGFTIDPTLFKRFQIKAVPTLVATTQTLDTCITAACDNDPVPDHDRVAGNIPLATLMQIIAIGGSKHAPPVIVRLEARQ